MPRTQEEIQKRMNEINQEMDSIARQLIKLNRRLQNNDATLDDKVLNESLYAYMQKLNNEFGHLILELSDV